MAEVSEAAAADAREAVAVALAAGSPPPPALRAEILEDAARRVAARASEFAAVICAEAGTPIRQARVEVARCADTLVHSAVAARTLAGEMVPMEGTRTGAGKLGIVVREPVGVVAAITPFNFPLNLVAHKVGPAVAAGCPVVVKPAEATPTPALMLAETLLECGLPPAMIAVVPGDGHVVGTALVDHPGVAMISFTGSGPVGWAIRARRPRARVALELGNSTPVLVAADADVAATAARIAASAYTHAGQSCISVQRVYAEASVHGDLLDALTTAVAALATGDPADEATDVGPLIDDAATARVEAWIAEAVAAGARPVCGGTRSGPCITPAIIDGVEPGMRIVREELFGPAVGVRAVASIDEAIALANGTPYGLQAGIFTARVDRAIAWARRLRFAGVIINDTPTFRADQQPYGGLGESGNTREGPRYAVQAMTEPRLVVIETG